MARSPSFKVVRRGSGRNRMIPCHTIMTSNGALLTFTDAWAHRLPADEPTNSGKRVTPIDRFSDRRRDLLIEMVATYLDTHRFFLSPTPVIVYHITGERDLVPAAEFMVKDFLRLLVRKRLSTSKRVRLLGMRSIRSHESRTRPSQK